MSANLTHAFMVDRAQSPWLILWVCITIDGHTIAFVHNTIEDATARYLTHVSTSLVSTVVPV